MNEYTSSGASFYRRIGLLLILGAGICSGLAICAFSILPVIRVEKGPVFIKDAFLTAEVRADGTTGERTTEFPSDTPRIWCIVDVEAPKPIRVGVRWYYEGKLIVDQVQIVERRGGWYIEPIPGERFQPGEYRVEVYLVRKAIRTLYFKVTEP